MSATPRLLPLGSGTRRASPASPASPVSRASERPLAGRPVAPFDWTWNLPYPVRNMLNRWRGMIGMVIGVGIALAIGMTLLGTAKAGIDNYTIDFRRSGANLYVVAQGGTLVPALPSDSPGTMKNARHLLAKIRQLPEVNAALGMASAALTRDLPGPRRAGEPVHLLVGMGVDGDPASIANALSLSEGRWLRRSDEVVVGPKISREESIKIGDTLSLSGREFDVVGIGKLRGLGAGFSPDAIVYLDYNAFRQRAELGDLLGVVVVDARDPVRARANISALDTVSVFDPADLTERAETVNAPSIALNWILILLTLSIAALFVSNMLGRSVIERRLEFATLRAIGIPGRTVLMTVGVEAVAVSLAAGILGTVLSLGLGAMLNRYGAPAYGLEFIFVADAGLYGVVFALAIFLGIGSGLLPARRAMAVDPADVLREA